MSREQRENTSVSILRTIIRQATEKKRVPEYVSVHIVNATEVLCELDDCRAQLAAAERERDALQKFVALQDAWELEAMGDITALFKERNALRTRDSEAVRHWKCRAERAEAICCEVASSGVENDYGKYLTVQIDSVTWAEARALSTPTGQGASNG